LSTLVDGGDDREHDRPTHAADRCERGRGGREDAYFDDDADRRRDLHSSVALRAEDAPDHGDE
jgi:hypothetical protein